jgi:hypothetical protein
MTCECMREGNTEAGRPPPLRAEKLAPWRQATVNAHFCAGRDLSRDVEAESVVCACETQDCGVRRATQCQLDKREAQKRMLICTRSS